jgi:hypothetical protein
MMRSANKNAKQGWLLQDLRPANKCSIGFDGTNLILETPYNPGLVAQLKALIPYNDRRWDPDQKVWLIRPDHGPTLQSLIDQFFDEVVDLPGIENSKPEQELRIIEVRYLGSTKDRGDAERSAFGLVDGEWSVLFPESVLRSWFEVDPLAPIQGETLYSVLGARKTASEGELKSAFRRMARQWHPDVCSEPNANEIFQQINRANQVLSNPEKRARYDAGLVLEETWKAEQKNTKDLMDGISTATVGYRSPLRCGWIMVKGIPVLGRFEVQEILDWQDIVNDQGQVLVSSWAYGDKKLTERWI